MNVLFATSWFPSKLHPTVGNFVLRHAHSVKTSGHKIIVVHEAYSNKILFPSVEESNLEGLRVIHLFFPRWITYFPGFKDRTYKKLFRKLTRITFSPDIVHGNVLYPVGYLASVLSKRCETPLVFTEHWTGFQRENSSELEENISKSIKATAENVDMFLPVSEDLGTQMKKHGIGNTNYITVNNTVDTSLFYPVKRTEKAFTFLHISALGKKAKNPEGIIRAFYEVNHPKARLVIGGDGDIEQLKNYAKEIGVNFDKIDFLGTLKYGEVALQMQSADCFVLFSNFENLPCVIAESHCCGIPVITTDVGGTAEMIDGSNGILIEAGNIDQLKSAMLNVMESYTEFNSQIIAEKASRRYGYKAIGKKFTTVYEKLTTAGG